MAIFLFDTEWARTWTSVLFFMVQGMATLLKSELLVRRFAISRSDGRREEVPLEASPGLGCNWSCWRCGFGLPWLLAPQNELACSLSATYQVCLGCGIKRLFDEKAFRAYGPFSYDLDRLISWLVTILTVSYPGTLATKSLSNDRPSV